MSILRRSIRPALFSVMLTAMLLGVMLLAASAVYADGDYKVNYRTYADEDGWVYVEPNPKTVGWEDTGLDYTGDTYPIAEQYAENLDMEFKGWYADPGFQTRVTSTTKYSDIAKDPSVREITLYARIGHTKPEYNYEETTWIPYHEGDYAPWGYTDRLPGPKDKLPDDAAGWYLLENVSLSNYTSEDEAAWTVPEGTTRLCLNGHNITRAKKQDEQGNEIDCSVISIPENATLILTDHSSVGTISGGKAGNASNGYGGGIIVRGELNMQQGVISGNEAENGGGVAVLGKGVCGLYFCDIKRNNVPGTGYGGGVYVDKTATLHLGSDNVSTPKVTENTAGGKASDVSVEGSGEWNPIEIGGLSSKSHIGVETRTQPEMKENGGIVISTEIGEAVDASRIISNDERLEITRKQVDGVDKAVLGYTRNVVTFKAEGTTYEEQIIYGGETAALPETAPTSTDGRAFKEWLLNDKPYDFDTPVTKDLTLVARFEGDHYHNDKLFTEWTLDDSLPKEAGNYCLTKDVTLSSTYELKNTVDVHICLNGHTITKKNGGTVLSIDGFVNNYTKNDPHLSIYDCSEGEKGKITGASGDGGTVKVRYGAFALNGGNIAENNTSGISATAYGTVVMNGGKISGNTHSIVGYGDLDSAEGVRVARTSTFKMNGGTISDNEGPGIALHNSTLELGGGRITGNHIIAYEDGDKDYNGGGGIFVGVDSVIRILGTEEIIISDNKYEGKKNNVYLEDEGIITFADQCAMNADSRIGVSTDPEPTEDKAAVFTEGLGEHAAIENFVSDNGEYQVRKNADSEAELYYDPIVIKVEFSAGGGSGEMKAETTRCNQDYELPECDFEPKDGYEFDKWLIGEKEYDEKATVKLKEDTTVTARWKPIVYSITYELAEGVMEEGTSNPETYTIESETITLTPPVRACYEFAGWTGTDLDEPAMEVTIPKGTMGDKAYTATWKPIEYTISYMLNGGKLPAGKTNPYTYTVESEDITLAEPVLSGSSFRGWYLMGSDMAETKEMVIKKGSSGHKVFIALWGDMDHKHKLTPVAAKDATCETDGNIAHYVCSCGQAFLDEEGTKRVDPAKTADKGGVILPGAHKWGKGEITKEPTGTENGIRSFTCAVCGQTRTEEVSKADLERDDAKAAAAPAIDKAKAIKAGTYSARSYAAVASALKNLEKLLADGNANAAQIKSATEKLQKAIGALKMDQKLTVKKKTVKVKVKKVKKKARIVKPLTVKGAKTKVTYKGVGLNKKSKKALKINKKTGKITVKKKTKKGTYKMKVTVTAAGNAKYEAAKKTVTVIVKVRK